MDHFAYHDGEMYAEDVRITDIAEQVGTPFYCYSTATLQRHFTVFDSALEGLDHQVCFAVKSNSNVAVLATLAQVGAGADIVSVGELYAAQKAGIAANNIVFSGVAKTAEEMSEALDAGILQFNVESVPELELLNHVAQSKNMKAPTALRVNPDVDPQTHAKISTGKKETKFGIAMTQAADIYAQAAQMDGIHVQGVSMHIGSQLTQLQPFEEAYQRAAELVKILRKQGHDITVLDVGGGLGIPYQDDGFVPPPPSEYGEMVRKTLGHLGCKLVFEPGRLIAGNAGIMVSKVIYVKEGEDRQFMIIDGAMNDLIRPAMYEAHHDIIPVVETAPGEEPATYDIVGPVCESGDTFAKGRVMSEVKADDLVAFRSAGAYGAVMASEYNSRPLIPEVLVKGDQFAVIRRRPTFDEMINRDTIPEWL